MRRYLQLLRNRPFAALWAGSTVSGLGDSMVWVALVWLAFGRGGPGAVATLVVVSMAPVIAGGLLMGMALDRFDRRRVLITVNAALGLAVAMVPAWAAIAGSAPTWLLFAVAALYGLLKMANYAGIPSLVPVLVGPGDLNTANAMESASYGVADVGGPALGGALIALVGAQGVLVLDALTYAAFLVCLLGLRDRLGTVRGPEVPPTGIRPAELGDRSAPPPAPGRPTGLLPAFAFLWRTPAVLATTAMFMAFNVGGGVLLVLVPAYTRAVLHGGAGTFGALLSVYSLGALAGSVAIGAMDWRPSLGRSIAVSQALGGAALLVLVLRPGLGASIATMGAAGLLGAPLTIWAQTIRMRLIPEELRGRVFGLLRTLIQSTLPIGGALAGLLLAGPGLGPTIVLVVTLMSVPGIVGLVIPALADRHVRAPTPAAGPDGAEPVAAAATSP